jgi:hypothetical protein
MGRMRYLLDTNRKLVSALEAEIGMLSDYSANRSLPLASAWDFAPWP